MVPDFQTCCVHYEQRKTALFHGIELKSENNMTDPNESGYKYHENHAIIYSDKKYRVCDPYREGLKLESHSLNLILAINSWAEDVIRETATILNWITLHLPNLI